VEGNSAKEKRSGKLVGKGKSKRKGPRADKGEEGRNAPRFSLPFRKKGT